LLSWEGLIRGEVAEIIDQYTVIINVGMDQGVKKGMRFVVYSETQRIFDRSGNDLGLLEIPKCEVEITDVQEKLSIAKNTVMVKHTLFESPLAQMFETRQPLPVDEGQITKIEVDRRIRKGDKVRQMP
jgi:hypothetical protein